MHKATDGTILILAVMMNAASSSFRGSNNIFLDTFWSSAIGGLTQGVNAPNVSTIADAAHYLYNISSTSTISPYSTFLPSAGDHFVYTGSYTTYPCTEGVTWLVMKEPVVISSDDLGIIRGSIARYVYATGQLSASYILDNNGNNARPVQPLNGRTVRHYSAVGSTIYSQSVSTTQYVQGVEDTAVAALVLVILLIIFLAAIIGSSIESCDLFDSKARNPHIDLLSKQFQRRKAAPMATMGDDVELGEEGTTTVSPLSSGLNQPRSYAAAAAAGAGGGASVQTASSRGGNGNHASASAPWGSSQNLKVGSSPRPAQSTATTNAPASSASATSASATSDASSWDFDAPVAPQPTSNASARNMYEPWKDEDLS
jgi:hypothetical protein